MLSDRGLRNDTQGVFTMSASMTVGGITQGLTVTAMAGFIAGLPPSVVLGAFAGAVIFVTSATEYPIKRRVLLSFLSLVCGLIAYKPIAAVIIGLVSSFIPAITSGSFERGSMDAAGAFVGSIVAVRIGTWLYRRSDNPGSLIPGGKENDKS